MKDEGVTRDESGDYADEEKPLMQHQTAGVDQGEEETTGATEEDAERMRDRESDANARGSRGDYGRTDRRRSGGVVRFAAIAAGAFAAAVLAGSPAMADDGGGIDVYRGYDSVVKGASLGSALTTAKTECGLSSSPASDGNLVRDIKSTWRDVDSSHLIKVCATADGSLIQFVPAGEAGPVPPAPVGCEDPAYQLVSVTDAKASINPRSAGAVDTANANGDDKVCLRMTVPGDWTAGYNLADNI